MTRTARTGMRAATPAVLLVGGGALAAATWAGGNHGLAIGLICFYLVAAAVSYLWAGRDTDVAAIMRIAGDERQRRIDRDATAVAGLAMSGAAILGAVQQAAAGHHDAGPYIVIMSVGGASYLLALLYLRYHR